MELNTNTILHGDALDMLRTLPDNSIDALVCDPPAGIGFMMSKDREWDSDKGGRKQWIEWLCSIMQEVYRVLRPGAHGLVWALPRTSHWTATALEDAGFEIRDCVYHLYSKHDKLSSFMASLSDAQRADFEQLMEDDALRLHIFGSGFPKSHDVSKAIDKLQGMEREVVGKMQGTGIRSYQKLMQEHGARKYAKGLSEDLHTDGVPITAPASPLARKYAGYGSALKPAVECWWLIRKPLASGSIAKNVLEYGTGAINIDACRVGNDSTLRPNGKTAIWSYDGGMNSAIGGSNKGRWPAHLLLSHTLMCTPDECAQGCPVATLDAQSGTSKSQRQIKAKAGTAKFNGKYANGELYIHVHDQTGGYNDQGGASRYFQTFHPSQDAPFIYTSKASRRERNAGCESLPPGSVHRYGAGIGEGKEPDAPVIEKNTHPTVKSQALMKYLVRLITPSGGVVLDCFLGSGSTALACIAEGFSFIGIEQSEEYVQIAQARINHALHQRDKAS